MASSSSTHTKVKLPMEEAVKADFPPGCKVLCFDDNGFRVGVVKNVMVSISLPSKHVFGTFYEVEMKSNTSMDSKILGVFSQSDLRLTPGCPVEVDSNYFGSVFKFSGGVNGKVHGTIIGSFEVPPSYCNRCVSRGTRESTPAAVRKFYYSVRVKFHGMEEAVEAHGVPPDHISVPSLYSSSHTSDNSTIVSEVPGSIFFGSGTFEVSQAQHPSQLVVQVGDDFKENNAEGPGRPSPSISRIKSKQRLTPEDLPLQNSTQFNFKSSAMDGTLDESLNVMYQHENQTKTFGNIIANGDRALYDSESGSSFEGHRGRMDSAPIASPRKHRGRSSSRPREQSQSVHRSRSSSRTRVYETNKSGSVRSVAPNMIPRDPNPRRQVNIEMSQSSSVDSMNDYDNEDKKYQYDVHGQDMVDDERVERKGSQKMNRDLVDDSDEEYEDREDAGSVPTPRSRSNRDIAQFLNDGEDYERNDNIGLEESQPISHPSTPSSVSNYRKKFGKNWSPKVLSNGEPIDDAELKREHSQSSLSILEQQRNSQIVLESPSSKRENFQRSASSATQSTNVPAEPVSSTEGCYLLFDPASGGKLTMQYSKTVVNGAIGFWTPGRGKKIQGFKFKQNQGRSDLMKNIAGKDYKKKYFNGWCQFVKAAKMYTGFVCKWSEHERIETDIFVFYTDSCEVRKIEDGELFDVSDIDAVSCLPKGNATFDGVKTGEYGTFLNRGDAAGASTAA
jgi:hypothetical protein